MTYFYDGKSYTIHSPYSGVPATEVKAQLHCHTTNSDGQDTPVALAQAYKNAGYGFLAITDHDAITQDPNIQGLLFAPSIEEIGGAYHAHVVAYDVDVQTTEPCFPTVVDFHRRKGKAVSLAHPLVNGDTPIIPGEHAMHTVDGYNFVEVYNGLSVEADSVWDDLLTRGRHVYGLATDDCHNINSVYFNRGWVVVNAQEETKDGVLDALRRGDFYASNGNDITVSVNGNVITAESTNPSDISFIGKDGWTYHQQPNALTASYTIRGDEKYIRCVAKRVSDGKKAWGQPVYIDTVNGDDGYREALKAQVDGIYRQALGNGDFNVKQNGDSFVFTNTPAGGYTADMWKVHSDFTSTRVDIVDVTTPIARGDMGKYCARMTVVNKGAGTAMRLYQAMPTADSILFRGKTVAVGVWLRKNAAFNQGSVTINVYASTGTDEPAAATGRQILHVITIPHSELDNSKFKLFEAPVDINWNRNQLAVVVHINSDVPNGSALDVKRVQLCMGDKVMPYQAKSVRDDLFECQAYFQKSYNMDVAPGTPTKAGAYQCHALSTYSLYDKNVRFVRSMRTTPSVKIYSTSGAEGMVRERDFSVDKAAYPAPDHTGENGFVMVGNNSLVGNRIYEFHYTADARL